MFSATTGGVAVLADLLLETGVSFPYPGEQNPARLLRATLPDRVKVV